MTASPANRRPHDTQRQTPKPNPVPVRFTDWAML